MAPVSDHHHANLNTTVSATPHGLHSIADQLTNTFDAHGGHGDEHSHYRLAQQFEFAVEIINTVAGGLVLLAVVLAGINLIIVGLNSTAGSKFRLINPLHHSHPSEPASILQIRLMLGEQISLALGLLVASDILDTVLKPSHAYKIAEMTKMFFLMVLRTCLAYFLGLEMKELEEHQNHQSQHSLSHSSSHHLTSSSTLMSDFGSKDHDDETSHNFIENQSDDATEGYSYSRGGNLIKRSSKSKEGLKGHSSDEVISHGVVHEISDEASTGKAKTH